MYVPDRADTRHEPTLTAGCRALGKGSLVVDREPAALRMGYEW
jgi:hypothetical protein